MGDSIAAGTRVIAIEPLLTDQAGTGPDLVLVWNEMPAATRRIDLVLHIHGYSASAVRLNIATEKLPDSGLDFGDPDDPPGATPQRNRPTLCILPRGHFFGGRTGNGYNFPVLAEPPGCARLVQAALRHFAETTSLRHLHIGRRILTAHSGGGAALMPVAAQFDPHEIHVFDGLYSEAPLLVRWAERAVAGDAGALHGSPGISPAAYMAEWGRALRVVYIESTGTEAASVEVAVALEHALAAAGRHGPALAPWYRAEAVRIPHLQIPRKLGWLLLADAGAAIA